MRFLIITIKKLGYLAKKINGHISVKVEDFGAQYVIFGIFGLLNYPLYYIIWKFFSSQSYESLPLRIVATLLCLFLVLNKYWPKKLQPWLPTYWYITLLFCLPFFFCFMLLKNHAVDVWLMSTTIVLVLLMLLVDWLSFIILLTLGVFLAWLSYHFTSAIPFKNDNFVGLMSQYLGSLAVVLLFARNKEKSGKERLNAMSSVATSIAHELRTPLATLNIGAKNIKKYFPYFSHAYLMASDANLPVETIKKSTFKLIEKTYSDMELETEAAALFIDMLLMNVSPQFSVDSCKTFSIAKCVTETLSRYPFSEEDRELIHWSENHDFIVKGEYLLITHILFNLLRNALFHIAKANKGEVYIWFESNNENKLCFKDTGTGIVKEIIGRIFDRFYTKTPHGTGIGLTFCRAAMESLGGEILCESIENEYTLFTLKFPKINSKF